MKEDAGPFYELIAPLVSQILDATQDINEEDLEVEELPMGEGVAKKLLEKYQDKKYITTLVGKVASDLNKKAKKRKAPQFNKLGDFLFKRIQRHVGVTEKIAIKVINLGLKLDDKEYSVPNLLQEAINSEENTILDKKKYSRMVREARR